MRWPLIAALAVVAACSFQGPGSGGRADAGNDATDCGADWAPINVDICALGQPGPQLDLGSTVFVYDTGSGMLAGGGSTSEPASVVIDALTPPVRVIYVEGFRLGPGAELRTRGLHPLIIASDSTIEIAGFLNASTVDISLVGAGADPEACDAVLGGVGSDNTGGAGGGGGGGHQGAGAGGGLGDENGAPTAGGDGGQALALPETPRGGCRGERGGIGDDPGGTGGRGGGAVQLSAAESITVETTALISASGGGGLGGQATDGGGGGGGSGGFIGLDAPVVTIADSARLIANGGGGGGGAANEAGTAGTSAADSAAPAPGGPGGGSGAGDGGDGGSLASPDAPEIVVGVNRGAGGGGGGVGYIRIWADTLANPGAAVISPSAEVTSPRQ